MHIIRPIERKDTEAFVRIAFEAGIGMTSMPKNRPTLIKRIEASLKSFAHPALHPEDESYLFVLENLETGEIGGTCGIIAKTGRLNPLSFFRIMKTEVHRGIDGVEKIAPILRVIHYKNYWSEICSLYVCENFRHSSLGRLLSLARFHFVAAYPERFDKMFFAEMRGHIDENNNSPFWEGIGRHFIDTKFETLMQLRDENSVDLREALPHHPIYIELLPKEVQAAIGKLHNETKPALKLLADEGFDLSDDIDICDGGPKITVETKTIRTVRTSLIATVGGASHSDQDSAVFVISTTHPPFRAVLSTLIIDANGHAMLPEATLSALNIRDGETIRYSLAYPENASQQRHHS